MCSVQPAYRTRLLFRKHSMEDGTRLIQAQVHSLQYRWVSLVSLFNKRMSTVTEYSSQSLGTAFYVWCFVPNDNGPASYDSVFDITLDDTLLYRYNHTSDGTTRLDDTIVYSNESLSNTAHNLSLSLVEGAILFDYIQYTYAIRDYLHYCFV